MITRRPAGSHLAGLWEFPGGKREPGEPWEACLVRELKEEIGCDVAVGGLFHEMVHTYPEKTVRLRFLLARLVRGEPHPLECAEVAWIRRHELSAYSFPAADAALLVELGRSDALWQSDRIES